MNESDADRRYGDLLDLLRARIDDEADEMLIELDEVVGVRLGEQQALAVQRLSGPGSRRRGG